jgi:hypothetical protein
MFIFLLLFLIDLYILYTTREPKVLREVKERYEILRRHLVRENKFPNIHDRIPISAFYKDTGNGIGYNSNKGYEIGLCLGNEEPNEVFHVLLHELAHCTVSEYDHTAQFWKNYMALREDAVRLGVYEKIPDRKPFCGQHIQDK